MNLDTVLTISKGALVMRRMGNRMILFVQLPGMTKAQVVAARLTKADCEALAEYMKAAEAASNTAWNRFEVEVVTQTALAGT